MSQMLAWRIVVLRLPGFIAAAFILTAAMLGNALASDEGDFLSHSELTLWRLGALAFAVPLLLPWRLVAHPVAWQVLIGWLCLDAIILTSRQVYQLVWFFGHRPFGIWVTYIVPTTVFFVAGVWMAVAAALIARRYRGYAPTSVRIAA